MRFAENIGEDHERLRAVVDSYEGKDPQQTMDEDCDYRLERVLDGLRVRLDALS